MIGGGIAGCTLAYELASRGVKVMVLEQTAIAAESSGRNTGTLLSGPQKEVVELTRRLRRNLFRARAGPVPFEFARIGHLLISEDEASCRRRRHSPSATGRPASEWRRCRETSSRATIRGWASKSRAAISSSGPGRSSRWARRMPSRTPRGRRERRSDRRPGRPDRLARRQGPGRSDRTRGSSRRTSSSSPTDYGWRHAAPDGRRWTPARAAIHRGRGWLIQLGKLDFELPWIVEELTWPDQEELGKTDVARRARRRRRATGRSAGC